MAIGNGRLLNKPDVEVKRLRRLAIEPEDEAAHDLEALRLQGVDGMERVLRVVFAFVCFFLVARSAAGVRVSRPEDRGKPRLPHGVHGLVILHEIHAGRTEVEGIVAVPLPGNKGAQQAQGRAPVADEVIIHEKETAAPPQAVQRLIPPAFAQAFWSAARGRRLGHLAELAIKQTPARELQQHQAVLAHGDQLVPRQGGWVRAAFSVAHSNAGLCPSRGRGESPGKCLRPRPGGSDPRLPSLPNRRSGAVHPPPPVCPPAWHAQ